MGFIQKAKDAILSPKNQGKARKLAQKHNTKIDEGIDRLGREVDKRTGGKHAGKIRDASQRAKGVVDGFAGDGADETRRDQPPRTASNP